jgi:putative membrane protein
MKPLLLIERSCLYAHLIAMAFGLAGLLWVMPHPEILELIPAGPTLFRWSMAAGGVVYILFGAIATALFTYRTLGWKTLAGFFVPAVTISLSCELLGTSTGLPFGDYSYLNGLGYKIAGLVPFTIPLSWFYLGLSAYLLARGGLGQGRWRTAAALVLGAELLMSWDFVLDPAMSQTAMPFWYWHEPGAFFGMPYQNFLGWMATGLLFMSIATVIWRSTHCLPVLNQSDLTTPLIIYLGNFSFALVMSAAAEFWIPIGLGILVGALPAIGCWWAAPGDRLGTPIAVVSSPVAADLP